MEFAVFGDCGVCRSLSFVFCVWCQKRVCRNCSRVCVQCEQECCKECYLEDLCCLVRPWGEKSENCYKELFHNKLIDPSCALVITTTVRYDENEHLRKALERSVVHYVDTFDAVSLCSFRLDIVRDFFPTSITKYVENEETRLKFIKFMEALFRKNSRVFTHVFANKKVKDELFSVMDKTIRSNEIIRGMLIVLSLESAELADLFESLKSRGLLDWNLMSYRRAIVVNLNAMKWIEENGINVVNNASHFDQFVSMSPATIMEYLMVEKGMTLEYMSNNTFYFEHDVLKIIYRLFGLESIQKIGSEKIFFNFETVKFLRSIGFEFKRIETTSFDEIYSLLCFKVWKCEDLDENGTKEFGHHVRNVLKDIKACKHFFPFMKDIRKRKITTFLCCVKKKKYILPKEIIWMILDNAFSPRNERGFV